MEFKPEDFKLNDYYYIREIKNKKDKIFDIFGDGMILMCKECALNFIKTTRII